MAEIKMDISEYEALKENKRLLEGSLEKERDLRRQIDVLAQEKLDALKKSTKSVTKIIRHEKREFLFKKNKNNYQIIFSLLNRLCSESLLELNIDLEVLIKKIPEGYIQNLLYFKEEVFHTPKEEVTTCGLDEITQEIRKDIQKNIEEDIKKKLSDLDVLNEKYSVVMEKIEHLQKENDFLTDTNNTFIKEKNKLKKIASILSNGYGFTGKAKLLDSIISIINEQK